MKQWLGVVLAVGLGVIGSVVLNQREVTVAAEGAEPMIVHNVYFSLKENTPAARQKLVDACKKYLADHPGTVYFSAGVLAEEFKRDVNDREFDVALHLVFKDRAAHDKYQDAPRHNQFIEENKANWKKVRVFDSKVTK